MKMDKTYLDIDDTVMLEKAATNTRDQLLIRVLCRLGCRVSEAIALTVDDMDFSQGKVTIQHLKTRIKVTCPQCKSRLAKAHTYCPGCGNRVEQAVIKAHEQRRVRTLPVDCETIEILEHFINKDGPISRNGKRMLFGINRHRAWQIIKECAEKADLDELINPETGRRQGISPHRLRDAFAVHAVKQDDSGDGLRMLQEHLGHASFNTTARYRKVAGEEHREWYEKLWAKGEDGD
jgi:integrase/recombinase XerD